MSPTDQDRSIHVNKTERRLFLLADGKIVSSFPVLIGENPGPKQQEGDRRTPEGEYSVLRLLPDEEAVGKGYYKGLHLSYPEERDARLALSEGRIKDDLYREIVSAYAQKDIPPQESSLGGFVAIHGGLSPDETFERGTKGCIVLRSPDMEEVYQFAHSGMKIVIEP